MQVLKIQFFARLSGLHALGYYLQGEPYTYNAFRKLLVLLSASSLEFSIVVLQVGN